MIIYIVKPGDDKIIILMMELIIWGKFHSANLLVRICLNGWMVVDGWKTYRKSLELIQNMKRVKGLIDKSQSRRRAKNWHRESYSFPGRGMADETFWTRSVFVDQDRKACHHPALNAFFIAPARFAHPLHRIPLNYSDARILTSYLTAQWIFKMNKIHNNN